LQKVFTGDETCQLVVECLRDIVGIGPRSSYIKINGANLLVRIISGAGLPDQKISDMYFPAVAVSGYEIRGIHFIDCQFDCLTTQSTKLNDVSFTSCSITEFVCGSEDDVHSVIIDSESIPDAIRTGGDDTAEIIYSPLRKREILRLMGFSFADEEQVDAQADEHEMDERIVDIERLVRAFRQATQMNDNVLVIRLGSRWPDFERNILPELLRRGILVEVDYNGSGHHRRYKLGIGFDDVIHALQHSRGDYDVFLDELKKKP